MIKRLQSNIWVLILSAGMVVTLSMGIRQSFGLFLTPITVDLGIGRADFAFAMALQQIIWGASQPFAGMAADKFGTTRTLLVGVALYVIGLMMMSQATTAGDLNFGGGLLIGLGLSSTTFAVVLGAVGRLVDQKHQAIAFAATSAWGSFGQFFMAPVGQELINELGWSGALTFMAGMACVMGICGMVLMGRSSDAPLTDTPQPTQKLSSALAEAFQHRGYILLTLGFFVCGFQVAFIAVHLPAYLSDLGLPPNVGSTALALIGFFNIFGTFAFGALGGKWPKKYLLSILYFSRAIVVIAFLMLPKTDTNIMIFTSMLGFLWLGTVPLTSGLVAQIFGPRYVATLFGFVFFSHQVGSFLGVFLGGYLYDTTGSYDLVWQISIALGFASTLIHLPIADKSIRQPA